MTGLALDEGAKPLADLGRLDCRWPVKDADQGEGHLFCGLPADEGKPYCLDHCRLAYRAKGQGDD